MNEHALVAHRAHAGVGLAERGLHITQRLVERLGKRGGHHVLAHGATGVFHAGLQAQHEVGGAHHLRNGESIAQHHGAGLR